MLLHRVFVGPPPRMDHTMNPIQTMTARSHWDHIILGSPVVPFTLFVGSGFLFQVTNQKQCALIIIWLLG